MEIVHAPRIAAWFLTAALTFAGVTPQQQSGSRANWPCGAHIDPSYFSLAEATGGQMLLLAPGEIASSADLAIAYSRHPQTIFRLGGTITPGVHEFRVPVDSTIDSAMFSISVQCLQTAEVLRPSGATAAGEGISDLSNFVATRLIVAARPEPGTWTLRVSGSGVAGVVVKARSKTGIASVEFGAEGTTTFTRAPVAGVENAVRLTVSGHPTHLEASLVDAAAAPISTVALRSGERDGAYLSSVTPPRDGFRLMITGQAEGGAAFQRVYGPLLTAR